MLSKNQLKFLQSLKLKKFRDLNQSFTVEGIKLVDDLLVSDFKIKSIFGTPGWYDEHKTTLLRKEVPFTEVSEEELERASNLTTPHEVIAVAAIPDRQMTTDVRDRLVLLLDSIRDPGNLGTIIRTADWFGIRQIICSEDTVEAFNPKVVQATMGSIFRVEVYYTGLVEYVEKLKTTRSVYGAAAGGTNIYTFAPELPAAVIIGNESQGISGELFRLIDQKIGIPRVEGSAESLNASVAAGIICSEFARKMNHGGV